MFLTRFSLRNPIAILILVILVAVGGAYSATQFKQESMPDIAIPYLFVTALYPGATPQEVQNEVALPLEQALKQVEGVQVLESTSASNVVTINMQFSFSADLDEKAERIEEVLNGIRLPQGVEKPVLNKITLASGPMMYTAVTAKPGTSVQELQQLVQGSILPSLQGIDGIGKVQTAGLASENLYIRLKAGAMAEKGVSYMQISQVLQAVNVTLPVGSATIGKVEQNVLITGRVHTIEELRQLAVSANPPVLLQDVAEITRGSSVPETISRVQGEPSVAINIIKNSDANSVDVSDQVMEKLEAAVKGNEKVSLDVVYDSADDIKRSVNSMAREGLLGALFASILILLFLRNLRATLIAIVSIPLSIAMAMALLHTFSDVTLNIMTLGGMAVAVGRVVDDSIVVIENIVRRIQTAKPTKELMLDATREVAGAITSSTLTTIAVFAPLGLVSGLIGKVFAPFALTVVFSLLASLLVAVTVVPLMALGLMRYSRRGVGGAGAEHTEDGDTALSRGYKKLLRWSLNHKIVVVLLSLVVLAASFILAPMAGMTFIPEQKEKFVMMTLTMPKGTGVNTVDERVQAMDRRLRELGHVKLSQVTSGSPKGEFDPMTYTAGASNKATWIVSLDEEADVTAFIKDRKRELDPKIEGATLDIQELTGGPGGQGVYIIVTGPTPEAIRQATLRITEVVQSIEGTDGVRNTLLDDLKSVELKVRPADALKYGLTTAQAWSLLRPLLNEEKVGKLGDGKRTSDIYLTVEGVSRNSLEDIAALPLLSPAGLTFTVRDIADVREVKQLSALQLRNGADFAAVLGNIIDKDAGKVNSALEARLDALELPAGTDYLIEGANKQIEDMLNDMFMAMAVAVGMVYIVMVVAFGGGKAPFAILFSLPFAVTGALAGTLIAGEPISIASLIGILMLIGIVVTNAIVLVDRVQTNVRQGQRIRDALLEAGGTRLRPILMTAIATICALLPLALELGEGGALISKGLAVVVIGGLVTSTLLTLLIVPIMYEALHYKQVRRERRGGRRLFKVEEE
ncbi:efflux RND transporter permease subunit [Paenibacillus koleovorans]|uniref:efflux RND transporter permease subunit n=1 Tax=Paenibacillus koleovorans TaxID=121608 RepID=UPI000FDC1ED0|nr:efflux RND transporter permease subunit [Paenibacillus koleovorans]